MSNSTFLQIVYSRIRKALGAFRARIAQMRGYQAETQRTSKCRQPATSLYPGGVDGMTRLKTVLNKQKSILDSYGVSVSYNDSRSHVSFSANLDSDSYVGTITHWPDSRFEIQFNSCKTGDVVLLETKDFADDVGLAAYIADIYRDKLK